MRGWRHSREPIYCCLCATQGARGKLLCCSDTIAIYYSWDRVLLFSLSAVFVWHRSDRLASLVILAVSAAMAEVLRRPLSVRVVCSDGVRVNSRHHFRSEDGSRRKRNKCVTQTMRNGGR